MAESNGKSKISGNPQDSNGERSENGKTNALELVWNLVQLHKLQWTILTKLQEQVKKLIKLSERGQ